MSAERRAGIAKTGETPRPPRPPGVGRFIRVDPCRSALIRVPIAPDPDHDTDEHGCTRIKTSRSLRSLRFISSSPAFPFAPRSASLSALSARAAFNVFPSGLGAARRPPFNRSSIPRLRPLGLKRAQILAHDLAGGGQRQLG